MGERPGPNQSDADLAAIRRLASRRRLLGQRVRRVLPGLLVGSATLTGSGALAAWVGHQPDIHTVSSPASAAPMTVGALGPLVQQLQADETEVNALQSAMANLQKQRAAVAAQGGAAQSSGGSLGTIPPLPAIPSVSISPAPAVNATTGASHAIP